MRTTVTLDPDVAVRLLRLSSERGSSFKATINEVLRAGLDGGTDKKSPYQESVRSLGARPGIDLTKALHLADSLGDEAIVGKLELRK